MVEGKILISEIYGKALYYPGASHSFISVVFSQKLNLQPETMAYQVEVQTPLRVGLITYTMYWDCPVVIRDQVYSANLIQMPIQGYDLILEMDWLYHH